MTKTTSGKRLSGTIHVISDTGPLISAFQAESVDVLLEMFTTILVPKMCVDELYDHGWEDEFQAASTLLKVVTLTEPEKQHAFIFAERIAQHSNQQNLSKECHIGESQAIVLACRPEYERTLLLLDELAARIVAKEAGVKISGFPGVLLSATQVGLISPDNLKRRLEICRMQGTHYGESFVEKVYKMAKESKE